MAAAVVVPVAVAVVVVVPPQAYSSLGRDNIIPLYIRARLRAASRAAPMGIILIIKQDSVSDWPGRAGCL